MTEKCHRCGKKAKCQGYSMDLDLPTLYFCADCKMLAHIELLSREIISKSGTCREWREAFDRPRA